MKQLLLFLVIISGVASCASSNTVRITVASKKVDCIGVIPQKCLLIKENETANWTYFYQDIKGLKYEEGYGYLLKVKKVKIENPPADASSVQYILVKEMSKTDKSSSD